MTAPPHARSVFTDGACSGNPGPGGWAWAVDSTTCDSGGEPVSTNQRMEIRAAAGGERLDVRRELLPRPMVGGLAQPRLAHLGEEARRQP
jgi:hypothetical protein